MPKCQYCKRVFFQEWTKQRHERLCEEKRKAEDKHPERYVGIKR